jgi:hypothetical protein
MLGRMAASGHNASGCFHSNFLGNSLIGCAGLRAVSARFSAAYWFVVGHDTLPPMGGRYAQAYPRVRTRFVAAYMAAKMIVGRPGF